MGENLENSKNDLLGKTDNNVAVNSIAEIPIGYTFWKRLFVSESFSVLKKEKFSSHKIPINISISD